jgi:pimeloyl-ACP methyl ester carboxylesterase
MPKVLVDGVQLNYELAGQGPDLVLIHGLTGNLTNWKSRIQPALVDQFRVLTYDLRGHGQSDMPVSGYTVADMTRDLAALLDHLELDRVRVVGHSFGGQVALGLCILSERVAGLTICDSRVPAFQPDQKVKDWAQGLAWKAKLQEQGIVVDEESEVDFALLKSIVSQSSTQLRESKWWDGWTKLLDSTSAEAELQNSGILTTEAIGQLRVPMQALYGELSFCRPTLNALRERVPHLDSTVIPGVGHWLPLVKPEVFVKHVKRFHGTLNQTAEESVAPARFVP